jgi:hypothetical protein
VTLAPSAYGYGICGLNGQGGLWALETQGKVTLAGRTKWDGTAHVMAFSVDRKDIEASEAICILPFSKGTMEVFASSAFTSVSCGEIIDGRWNPFQTIPVHPDASGKISFTVEDHHLRTILLLHSDKAKENLDGLVEPLRGG